MCRSGEIGRRTGFKTLHAEEITFLKKQ